MFNSNSRYAGLKVQKLTLTDGREVVVVPPRRTQRLEGNERVAQGYDRLDLLAQKYLADANQYHRIGDANSELDTRDLLAEAGDAYRMPEPK